VNLLLSNQACPTSFKKPVLCRISQNKKLRCKEK